MSDETRPFGLTWTKRVRSTEWEASVGAFSAFVLDEPEDTRFSYVLSVNMNAHEWVQRESSPATEEFVCARCGARKASEAPSFAAPFPIITTTVELETRSETNQHTHWRERNARAREANAVVFDALAMLAERPDAQRGLVVRMTRIVGSERELLDDDNVAAALKAVRDAVARWLGIDDRSPCVTWIASEMQAPGPMRARLELFYRGGIGEQLPGVVVLDAASLLAVAETAALAARAGLSAHTLATLARAGLLTAGYQRDHLVTPDLTNGPSREAMRGAEHGERRGDAERR
jgi:hypothetical protein